MIKVVQDKFYTSVSVTDTGVGIPAERIEKLFSDTTFETTFGTNREIYSLLSRMGHLDPQSDDRTISALGMAVLSDVVAILLADRKNSPVSYCDRRICAC